MEKGEIMPPMKCYPIYTDDDALRDAVRYLEWVNERIDRDQFCNESPDAQERKLVAWLVKKEIERMNNGKKEGEAKDSKA